MNIYSKVRVLPQQQHDNLLPGKIAGVGFESGTKTSIHSAYLGSRMIVACVPTRGSGDMFPPQENFYSRSSQIASDAIWDKLSNQHFDEAYLCPVTCKIN